jgi:hypothetical protein
MWIVNAEVRAMMIVDFANFLQRQNSIVEIAMALFLNNDLRLRVAFVLSE